MDGDIGYQLRTTVYDKKTFGLGGVTLSTFAKPGTNYEAIVEETAIGATSGSGPVIPLIKFDIKVTLLSIVIKGIDLYEYLFPIKWKDAVSYYFELPQINRQLRMSMKFAENIITSYCYAARQRCLIDEGVTLADARRTMSSLIKSHGNQVIPRHVAIIISHNSSVGMNSQTPITLQDKSSSLQEDVLKNPSKLTTKNEQKIKNRLLKLRQSEAKEIMKIISYAVDFILWSLELGIQYITIHEALGKLVLQYGEMASILSERLTNSTAQVRLYFPATDTCIHVFENSWEVVPSDWAKSDGNEEEFIGLTAIISKVGDGFVPRVRKSCDFLHGLKNSNGRVVTPEEINILSLIEFIKDYTGKHDKEPSQEDILEQLCKSTLGIKQSPQLLVFFGCQQFLEGFPYYLLANAIAYSPPHHFDYSIKAPNVKDYIEGLVTYSKTLNLEKENSQ